MTGLPFVWAFWAGRPDVLSRAAVSALVEARDAGVAASDSIAAAYCGPRRAVRGQAYLKDNIRYTMGEREEAGLLAYYDFAERHGIVDAAVTPVFYR
jgi:predicted solute-binding protein